ncbi:MAG: hypothetical protein NVSMB59_22500 [Vulcanimicrobiaceae bacterium]
MNAQLESAIALCEAVAPLPKPRRFTSRWVCALVACDLVTLAGSAYLGIQLVERFHPHRVVVPGYATAAAIVALQIAIFFRLQLYRNSFSSRRIDEVYYVCAALTIGAMPLFVLFTLLPILSTSRLTILTTLAISIPIVGGTRSLLYEARCLIERHRSRRVALVGDPARLGLVAHSLYPDTATELLKVQVDDLEASVQAMHDDPTFDPSRIGWFASALAWRCDVLLLTETLPPWSLPTLLAAAAKAHVKLAFAPPRFRVQAYGMSIEVDGEQTLLVPTQLRACTGSALALKRIVDACLAAVVLLLVSPVLAACALAIALESGGPIVYRQRRVGLAGRTFEILKLRSMRIDAERISGPVWACPTDGRATRVGRFLRRFSLDELPQFWNVVRGEMSIVGPRPERPEFVAHFRHIDRYDERHLVRPGITGWSQINLRRIAQPTEVATRLSYDLFYIEEWSPFLDLYIVVKTAFEFLFHKVA